MKNTPIPSGTKDVLPAEAIEQRWLESRIRGVFDSFAYQEVITPTFELQSAMDVAGEKRFNRSFRLFDERGEVLMMRPEMTTPIARLVSTRMADREPPFRLSYFASSFRPTTPQRGRQSEFHQAGLELIGADSPAVDAEVLAVLCQTLTACGLEEFSVGLGESSFFKALLDSAGVKGEDREAVFNALAERDLVKLSVVVAGIDISDDDRDAILGVTRLRGGSEVLIEAQDYVRGPAMEEALKRLARTYYLVSRYGFAGRILFDLGILSDFDYYTGIVFEVLSGELGFPVGSGGRYDGLLARFGRPEPAVGFAIGLDRLHIAITDQGGVSLPYAPGIALVGGFDPALDLAMQLREKGVDVMALPEDMKKKTAMAAAEGAGIGSLVMPDGDGFKLFDTAGGKGRKVKIEDIIDAVAAG
ncbi:MAG: ATP phosphoribosyltransferase regulatory subunit [Thermoleophilia bacterium]